MSSIRLATTAVLLSTVTLGNSVAIAKQCDEIFQEPDGGDYYQLNKPPVDKSTTEKLRLFAEQINGNWRGTALEIECGISNGVSHHTISNFDIDAQIRQHFLGAIIIDAEKDSKRAVKLEKVFISPEIEKQRQGKETGYRSYSVEFTSPTTMVFDEKYRVHNNGVTRSDKLARHININDDNPIFQRMIHEIKSVELERDTLKINRDLYVNGHFVSNQAWQLTRIN